MRMFLVMGLPALLLSACISQEPRQLVPDITLSAEAPEPRAGAADSPQAAADLGFSVTDRQDSAGAIAALPGLRVSRVSPGGPADFAGILAGDVILRVDQRPVNDTGTLNAIAAQIDSARQLPVEIRRDTTVFTTVLDVRPADERRREPVELYRVDPVLLRAGLVTALLTATDGQQLSGARIVDILPESPFPGAGLREDDVLLEIGGIAVESAQGAIRYVHANHQPGDRVGIRYARGQDVYQQTLSLWDPGRRFSKVSLRPLLHWESTLQPDRSRLNIGDFWIFSLFSYQREDGEREYRLLGLFSTATGYGELLEE